MDIPLVSFGLAVLTVSPSKILPTLSLLVVVLVGKCWRDSLDVVQLLLSSSQNTDVLSTLF